MIAFFGTIIHLSFAVTDLYAHGLNSLENFQRAYEIGLNAVQS